MRKTQVSGEPASPGSAIDPARVFHALGDPTRRAIVEMLGRAPRTVSGLAAALQITLTAVGQHLAILEACGLARTEKLGRVRTCSLERIGLDALERWIKERRTPLEHGLDRLGSLLAEEAAANDSRLRDPDAK
ncbi:MAG TPA: metalloregulator ArsR/SmtB family transcription factor [Acidobacteriaceae bacterium]|nr:metalloregulator ArsR/SmtB family transcription factor [Acidobacteriaceae bacterium]